MENGFLPEGLKLFDPKQAVKRVGSAIAHILRFNPEVGYHSNHEHRGAERALEEGLGYDNVIRLPHDSEGNWHNPDGDAA